MLSGGGQRSNQHLLDCARTLVNNAVVGEVLADPQTRCPAERPGRAYSPIPALSSHREPGLLPARRPRMTWMTDPHAEQILRGLYPEQYARWWKVGLRYGFVVLLAGIAAGGTFLKMRPSSPPIAPVTSEVGAAPKTTTFPSLLRADLPRMGWRNPEVEKMRRLLKSRPRTPKPNTAHHKRLTVHHWAAPAPFRRPVLPDVPAQGDWPRTPGRPRRTRTDAARAGHRAGKACHRRRSAYGRPRGQPSNIRGGSRMRESRTYGSGAARLAAIPAGASPANTRSPPRVTKLPEAWK